MKEQIKLEGNIVETSPLKPDLMAASPTSAGRCNRILAHLESGEKPATKSARFRTAGWTIEEWTLGLVFLLMFITSVAWLVHEVTIPALSALKYEASDIRTQAMPSHDEKIQMPVESANHAAVIVNEPAPRQLAIASATHAPAEPLAVVTKARSAAAAAMRLLPPTAKSSNAVTNVTARNATDTDVDLLAALIAHANKPTVVVAERSRDVVERRDNDTTAQLLARCKQLGLIEGMLCRSRMCSGHWDSDAACRAPAY